MLTGSKWGEAQWEEQREQEQIRVIKWTNVFKSLESMF